MPSFGSVAFSSPNVDGAGAQPVADSDSLDALFELLETVGSDARAARKSNGVGA